MAPYRCFTRDTPSEELIFCIRNLLGNIALFVPLGLLIPLTVRKLSSIRSVLEVALAVSVSIEAVQFAERWMGIVRSVDIDDVVLNLPGASAGYFCHAAVKWMRDLRV